MHSLNITASSPVNSAVVNFACYILDPNYGKGRLENTFFHFFFSCYLEVPAIGCILKVSLIWGLCLHGSENTILGTNNLF